jgi:hypothetical protein
MLRATRAAPSRLVPPSRIIAAAQLFQAIGGNTQRFVTRCPAMTGVNFSQLIQ